MVRRNCNSSVGLNADREVGIDEAKVRIEMDSIEELIRRNK